VHATEAIKSLRTLISLGAGAPASSREFLINKAEEHMNKAREAVGNMMRKDE